MPCLLAARSFPLSWPGSAHRSATIVVVALLAALMPLAGGFAADRGGASPIDPTSRRSDAAARSMLFGESILRNNAASVALSARELPDENRYGRLLRWVLPEHQAIRVCGEIRRSESAEGQRELADLDDDAQRLGDIPESRWLIAPARELIDVADKLDRLEELREIVRTRHPKSALEVDAIDALLTMINVRRGDVAAAKERIEERFASERIDSDAPTLLQQRWCDLLVLWSASENPVTSTLVSRELFGAFPDLGGYHAHSELDVINDYLRLLRGVASMATEPAKNSLAGQTLYDWFSRSDASTHGLARPLTRFASGEGGVTKISGHELDYFALRPPLTGDFEVNAVVSTRSGAFTEMMVHGTATMPIGSGDAMYVGTIAKGNTTVGIDPPLEQVESESHLRVAVRDGTATHIFNGRTLLRESVGNDPPAPWIALRSWRGTQSQIRDLRVTGTPRVPASIDLLSDSMAGWASYYDPDFNSGLGSWSADADAMGTKLTSTDVSGVRGCDDEDLLRYVRPLRYNAVIEYEFRYQPNQIHVHPVLGRIVFLLMPDGVRIHRLTDGRYDETDLRPGDSDVNDLTAMEPLELEIGWNRAKLRIEDNTVNVSVNDQLVARYMLADANSRQFGLFRYRDQTRAVVRNARLHGEWANSTFPSSDQPIASSLVAQLDQEASDLSVQFAHDFRQGATEELFDIEGDGTMLRVVAEGSRIWRSHRNDVDSGVRGVLVNAIVGGDFDIVAEYSDLEVLTGPPTWHCGIGLAFNLDNPTRDRCAVNRRRDRMEGRHYVAFGRKETNAGGQLTWIGGVNLVDESTSGKLRLVRRGNRVYGLHACADSNYYRLIESVEIPPGNIEVHGLRLITDVGRGMNTAVTWNSLRIAADEVDFLRVENQQATLQQLAELRADSRAERIDLAELSLDEAGISRPSLPQGAVVRDDEGTTVTVQGDERQNRFTLYKPVSLSPQFDVQVDFDVLRLDPGLREQASSEVVLQIRLQDALGLPVEDPRTQVREATIILRHKWNGKLDLRSRVVARGRGGKTLYLAIRSLEVEMPDQFRIVQHEKTLYFIYSDENSDEQRIMARYPLDRELNATAVQLWLIASREQRIAEARWKRLDIFDKPVGRDSLILAPLEF